MKKIVHLISRDKFTNGYVNFMNKYMNDETHIFFTLDAGFPLKVNCNDNVYFVSSFNDIKYNGYLEYLNDSDLIIVSGFFYLFQMDVFLDRKILGKTYFHLWGGDFYCLRNNETFDEYINNILKKHFLINAGGVINLISNDYDELCKYCSPKGRNFIAPMCDDGSKKELIKEMHSLIKKDNDLIYILLGNSATETNQHIQALKILKKYAKENIKIICPLSYGSLEYRNKVIEYGRFFFREKFEALTSFINIEDYYKIIAKCKIAIFNNNRQQAMGNINAALALNCKVFIRNDTAMWEYYYKNMKMNIFCINDILDLSFNDFIKTTEKQKENYNKYLDYSDINKKISAWKTVFDSIDI